MRWLRRTGPPGLDHAHQRLGLGLGPLPLGEGAGPVPPARHPAAIVMTSGCDEVGSLANIP